jgi:hypothetical protein
VCVCVCVCTGKRHQGHVVSKPFKADQPSNNNPERNKEKGSKCTSNVLRNPCVSLTNYYTFNNNSTSIASRFVTDNAFCSFFFLFKFIIFYFINVVLIASPFVIDDAIFIF